MPDEATFEAKILPLNNSNIARTFKGVHGVFFVNPDSYGHAAELFEKGSDTTAIAGDKMLFVNTQAILACVVEEESNGV